MVELVFFETSYVELYYEEDGEGSEGGAVEATR